MGYNSPITIMQNQMKMELENGIYKAVQKVGIEVDKDELIKALRYDRAQYDKGYNEARKETAREILTELKNTRFHKGTLTYDFEMAVNRLAKQYGVEIGEENV